MSIIERNNVKVSGASGPPLMFAHGFGCDQTMWRLMTPAFAESHQIILFDHVGAGRSDLTDFSAAKYSTLQGYADDVVEIAEHLGLTGATFVGHSVSAMIGALAAIRSPGIFERLVMIGPSARYINDDDYFGGFTEAQISELLEFLDANHLGWSAAMAPIIMGNPERPELAEDLTNSFCRTDPEIAKHFARTTFTADNRRDLPKVSASTLVLQCSNDVIAPIAVGEYVHRHLPRSQFVQLKATGHCPNLSAPEETIFAIQEFLKSDRAFEPS
jgi:sigma-B regulation protein RsbQ